MTTVTALCLMWSLRCVTKPQAKVVHWGLSDPSKLDGSDEHKRQAFLTTIGEIEQRVEKLIDIAKRPKAEQLDALQQLVKA